MERSEAIRLAMASAIKLQERAAQCSEWRVSATIATAIASMADSLARTVESGTVAEMNDRQIESREVKGVDFDVYLARHKAAQEEYARLSGRLAALEADRAPADQPPSVVLGRIDLLEILTRAHQKALSSDLTRIEQLSSDLTRIEHQVSALERSGERCPAETCSTTRGQARAMAGAGCPCPCPGVNGQPCPCAEEEPFIPYDESEAEAKFRARHGRVPAAGAEALYAWANGHDTCDASKTIAFVLSGGEYGRDVISKAPDGEGDLGRCIRLLRLMGWRDRLPEVAKAQGYPWGRFVDAWDDLERMHDGGKVRGIRACIEKIYQDAPGAPED